MQCSFKDPVTTLFDTATLDDGIVAAAIHMLLGVLAFGMYPIPPDLGVLAVDGIFSFSVPLPLNFCPLLPPQPPISFNVK